MRFHACILEIVDDTGFENLVEPVNVSSEPSDHYPPHNESNGKGGDNVNGSSEATAEE